MHINEYRPNRDQIGKNIDYLYIKQCQHIAYLIKIDLCDVDEPEEYLSEQKDM